MISSSALIKTKGIMDILAELLRIKQRIVGNTDLELSSQFFLDELARLYTNCTFGIFKNEKDNISFLQGKGFSNDNLYNIRLLGWWEQIANLSASSIQPVIWPQEIIHMNLGADCNLACLAAVPLSSVNGLECVVVAATIDPTLLFDDKFVHDIGVLGLPFLSDVVSVGVYNQLEELFLSTVLALASAVDAKHPYTHGHSERVTQYAISISKQLGLNKDDLRILRLSSLLHDVGKIGISELVLDKNGRLTDDEFDSIKRHPIIGAEIVGKIVNAEMIVPGIMDHHERYDGRGYPNGKAGEDISFYGRIIAVADSFDAMTSTRSYRKAMPFQIALEEIVNNSGKQFDPRVVKAFVGAYEKEKDIWLRESILQSSLR